MERLCVLACALMLAACASSPLVRIDPPAPGGPAHELVPSTQLQYLSCNEKYFGFLSDYSLDGAAANYAYALMASNTYVDEDTPHTGFPDGTGSTATRAKADWRWTSTAAMRAGRKTS